MKSTGKSDVQALAVFAHELREPLASILLAAQSQSETPCGEPNCHEMCKIVERQGQFLARMIADTLEVCGGSCDKLRLHKDWFDLNEVLAGGIESTRPLFSSRRHHLSVSLPAERMYVLADAGRVQQIVINLLANAAKYTKPGGSITFAASVTRGLTLIEVGDNGVGIAKGRLAQVFEMFHQVGQPRCGEFSGLGIGLALVKALAELHGGSVHAHSEGEGSGSVFKVRLPGLTTSSYQARVRSRGFVTAASPVSEREVGFMGDA